MSNLNFSCFPILIKVQIVWKYCSEDWISHKTADSCCFIYSEHIFRDFIFKVSFMSVTAYLINNPVYYCISLYLHICYFCVTSFCIQSWALRSQQSLSNIPQANLALGACPTNHCTICIHICACLYSHFVFRFLDFPLFCFWYLCTSQKLSLSDWHCKLI